MATHHVDGPYFEDFYREQTFAAPSVTVTDGHAALYQAIIGDRLRLPLDRELSAAVTGDARGLVHPMLVINLVNGQTTFASQHVKGNLFYRGLLLLEPVFVGDTLTTTTRVVGLKQNRVKPGRAATGMVALEMETLNQHGARVLRYWRCPMIPCRDPDADTGFNDDFDWIPGRLADEELAGALPAGWDLAPLDPAAYHVPAPTLAAGDSVEIGAQDTVTSAPELVRMTGNIAFTHTDASKSYLGQRLVYGGHTISLAFAQVLRGMPNMISLVGWQGCDHLGPVLEGDIVRTRFDVAAITPAATGGSLYALDIRADARRPGEDGTLEDTAVLDWRLVVWSL
ncbi:MAG: MaoC family dehydratase [Gammaproteobacteria bacterium]